ncbi:MAG: SBBP repeat-containing protein [Anaerolineae bacterium]|nr:SBBP repeat-containing protein [Caldilineales bacterium]MCX7853725.1 SBBP repeat-containing protein [Caldilineales bacterium]MDW8268926.1 SBBP repeat-containing protein [Anaerolineae bacterium]
MSNSITRLYAGHGQCAASVGRLLLPAVFVVVWLVSGAPPPVTAVFAQSPPPSSPALASNYVWHTFYGSASALDIGWSVAVDGNHNIYLVGFSEATWQGDGGAPPLRPFREKTDIVVVKLNSAGQYQWHTFYGSNDWDAGFGVTVDERGNVYVVGYSISTWLGDNNTPPLHAHSGSNDIVVIQLNSAGEYQWHTFYGGISADLGNAIVAKNGHLYIAGESYRTWQGDNNTNPLHAHRGGNQPDFVVLKLTDTGRYQWHTFYGSSAQDSGSSIAVDGGGHVYVTGSSAAAWQGDGGTNPLHGYNGEDDIAVFKLSSAGAYRWHTFYGSATVDHGYGVAASGDAIYVTGFSNATWQGDGGANPRHPHRGASDMVILKLSSAGAHQWHTFYGSADRDVARAITVDEESNVYVTGYSNATWQGDDNTDPLHAYGGKDDTVVVKLTDAGAYRWHTFYGATGEHDHGYGIAVDGTDHLYVTGWSLATWQGDDGADPLHPYSGGMDLFALRLSAHEAPPSKKVYLPLLLSSTS